MHFVFGLSSVILAISVLISGYRILAGPNSLDRLISVDMLVSIIISGLCLWCVSHQRYFLAPAIITLALLSFLGSVTVARYRVRDDQEPDKKN